VIASGAIPSGRPLPLLLEETLMIVTRVSPWSVAKIAALLYGIIGLFVGAIMSAMALLFGTALAAQRDDAWIGTIFGASAIVVIPILYGVGGGIMAAISAFIYNIAARIVGGVRIDVEP
jgi:hypothetical protein